MKSPRSNPSKDAQNDERRSDALLRPVRIEKVPPIDGEGITRKTRLTHKGANAPVEHSVEETLSWASAHPALLVDHTFWYVLLPWLENSQEDIDLFWKSFNRESKYHYRVKAVNGAGFANRQKERQIRGYAIALHGLREGSREGGSVRGEATQNSAQRTALVDTLLMRLGEWVFESVLNDHEAPKRLHEVLKSEERTRTTKDGDIFCAFVGLVAKELRLPTKKRVRHEAGLGDYPQDYSAASRAYVALGLSGLQEG